jgi:UDP-glucose 4-epimerase
VERILGDLDKCKGVRSVILRYFNAAGADPEGRIGERHDPENHVIPIAIEVAQGQRQMFTINGSDYPTRDGTCIRDFIHVADIANAHCRAVNHLLEEKDSVALNLGSGHGTSLRELVRAVEKVTQVGLPLVMGPRRIGDPPELVADNARALEVLDWKPRHDLTSILLSAWAWHKRTQDSCSSAAYVCRH